MRLAVPSNLRNLRTDVAHLRNCLARLISLIRPIGIFVRFSMTRCVLRLCGRSYAPLMSIVIADPSLRFPVHYRTAGGAAPSRRENFLDSYTAYSRWVNETKLLWRLGRDDRTVAYARRDWEEARRGAAAVGGQVAAVLGAPPGTPKST